MSPVRIKICGIKDIDTALAAVEAGADALGFVFAPSSRRITKEKAKEIIRVLPPFIDRVGVFVNASPEEVEETADFCGLTSIQLSGDEPPDYYVPARYKLIRGFRIGNTSLSFNFNEFHCDAFLFDSFQPGSYGGTGQTFNWEILKSVAIPKPVILAGGLNINNVRTAITKVRPYGVDVSSGVETNGKKDPSKIKEFVQLVKK